MQRKTCDCLGAEAADSDRSCSRAARCFDLSTSESPQNNLGASFVARHELILTATTELDVRPHLNGTATVTVGAFGVMYVSARELLAAIFRGPFEAATNTRCVTMLARVVTVDTDSHERRPRLLRHPTRRDVAAEPGELVTVDHRVTRWIVASATPPVDRSQNARLQREILGGPVGSQRPLYRPVDDHVDRRHVGGVQVVQDAPQRRQNFIDAFAHRAVALEAGGPVHDTRRKTPQDDISRIAIAVVQRNNSLSKRGFVTPTDLFGHVVQVPMAGDVVGNSGQDRCVRDRSHTVHMHPGNYRYTYRPNKRHPISDRDGYPRNIDMSFRTRFRVSGSYPSTYPQQSPADRERV